MIILLCRPKDTVRTPEKYHGLYHKALARYPKLIHSLDVRHERYNAQLAASIRLEEKGHAMIIAPESELDITTYTKDPAVLQGLYDKAIEEYEDYRENLLKFCGDEHCCQSRKEVSYTENG